MAELKAVDASLFAFRKRDARFVLTKATVAYIVLALALGGLVFAAIWPSMGAILHWYAEALRDVNAGGDPGAPPAELIALAPWIPVYMLLSMAISAAYEAACLRWLTRSEHGGGLLGLRLSADTWRVFATYWLWIALGLAAVIVIALLYAGIIAVSAVAGPLRLLVIFIAALTPLALAGAAIFFAVRLAPAAATSVFRQRFAFFGAWSVTRGRFWPLLGAFFLVIAAYVVISLILGQIVDIPMQRAMVPVIRDVAQGGGDVDQAVATAMQALSSPVMLAIFAAYTIVAVVIACVFRIALYGVNARAVLAAEEERASS